MLCSETGNVITHVIPNNALDTAGAGDGGRRNCGAQRTGGFVRTVLAPVKPFYSLARLFRGRSTGPDTRLPAAPPGKRDLAQGQSASRQVPVFSHWRAAKLSFSRAGTPARAKTRW